MPRSAWTKRCPRMRQERCQLNRYIARLAMTSPRIDLRYATLTTARARVKTATRERRHSDLTDYGILMACKNIETAVHGTVYAHQSKE